MLRSAISLLSLAVLLAACAAAPAERQARVTIGPTAPAPAGAGEQVHALAEGEELRAVAQRYGTTTDALIERNGIVSRQDLKPGRELVVPAPPALPPAPTGPAPASTPAP